MPCFQILCARNPCISAHSGCLYFGKSFVRNLIQMYHKELNFKQNWTSISFISSPDVLTVMNRDWFHQQVSVFVTLNLYSGYLFQSLPNNRHCYLKSVLDFVRDNVEVELTIYDHCLISVGLGSSHGGEYEYNHRPDDGGSEYLRNVCHLLLDYTAMQPRIHTKIVSSHSALYYLLNWNGVF